MTPRKSDPLLTGPEAAERLGIAPATWRSYVHAGYAPPADDPNRRSPRWLTSTVDHYAANRIGTGKRPTAEQRWLRESRRAAQTTTTDRKAPR